MAAHPLRTVLWSAGLRPAPLAERIEIAAATGYSQVSLSAADAGTSEGGMPPEELARRAADRGVRLDPLDGITEWYPHEPPKRRLGGSDHTIDDMLDTAKRFGASTVGAIAAYPTTAGIEVLAESFASLCDRAAERGLRVSLEFTPFPPVPDVATAWEVVRGAGRPNGGILFDTWHFYRGKPDFDALAAVPGERIFAVQVADGGAELRESLVKDTFMHRSVPGDGVFDLVGALRALDRIGGLREVGPEVLSADLWQLPPHEVALVTADALDRVLAAAFPGDEAIRLTEG